MKLIDNIILWYLKKNRKCFVQHGMTGWKVKINFHSESSIQILDYTLEMHQRFENFVGELNE